MTVVWTEAFSSFVPGSFGWYDYDIYTNKSVPKGAIAYIVCASVNDAFPRTVGVRTNGSALNRYTKLHEGEAGGAVCTEMYVKVNSSDGLIEIYCDNTTGITFYLLGWWTGVDFTEMYTDITSGSASTWTDSDIYTNQSVPKGRVVQIQCDNFNNGAAATLGVRTNGSALARYRNLHEAESATTEYTDCNAYSICVLSNAADGMIELWRSDATYGKHFLMGYFGPELGYAEAAPLAGSITVADTWTNWDLTAYMDQDGRVVEIVCGHDTIGAEHNCGARINGSSLARYILEHEAEDNGEVGSTYPTQTDASGILQIYCSNASAEQFDFFGYYTYSVLTTGSITKYSDSRFKKPQEFTKTSDAKFLLVSAIQKTADSRFKKPDITTYKTSDARLLKTQSIQKPSDAEFYGSVTFTKSSDARFKRSQSIDKSSAAQFYGPVTTTRLSDARFKRLAQELTKQSNAQFYGSVTLTKTSDAQFFGPGTITKDSNARFKRLAQEITKQSDARFGRTVTATKPSDAQFKRTQELTKQSDADFYGPVTITKFSDTRFKRLAQELSKYSDARILKGQSVVKYSDATFIAGTKQLTIGSDARFKTTKEISLNSSALFVSLFTRTVSRQSDARFFKGQSLTRSADARFQAPAITKASAARFKRLQEATIYSNARLLKTQSLMRTSDARLSKGQSLTKTADARFREIVSVFIASDARFHATKESTLQSDALFSIVGAHTTTIKSDAKFIFVSPVKISLNGKIAKNSKSGRRGTKLSGRVKSADELNGEAA